MGLASSGASSVPLRARAWALGCFLCVLTAVGEAAPPLVADAVAVTVPGAVTCVPAAEFPEPGRAGPSRAEPSRAGPGPSGAAAGEGGLGAGRGCPGPRRRWLHAGSCAPGSGGGRLPRPLPTAPTMASGSCQGCEDQDEETLKKLIVRLNNVQEGKQIDTLVQILEDMLVFTYSEHGNPWLAKVPPLLLPTSANFLSAPRGCSDLGCAKPQLPFAFFRAKEVLRTAGRPGAHFFSFSH